MPTYALSLLGREARSRMAETLPAGLRLGHLAVLGGLAEHSGQSQRSLAQALAIHPTDLVAIVDDLAERGLVSRDVDPEDRRRRLIRITAAGRRLVARATADSQRVLDDILAPLTTAERQTVARLLTAALRPRED
jgi:DNA-binding MarR family transcriptional regulator